MGCRAERRTSGWRWGCRGRPVFVSRPDDDETNIYHGINVKAVSRSRAWRQADHHACTRSVRGEVPDDFEANVRAPLGTRPGPHDATGSRRRVPEPPPEAKAKKRDETKARKGYRRTKAEAAAQGAAKDEVALRVRDYRREKARGEAAVAQALALRWVVSRFS
jgi:hypothetical protein